MKKIQLRKPVSDYLLKNKWQFCAVILCLVLGIAAGTVYAVVIKDNSLSAMEDYISNFVSAYNLQPVNSKGILSFSVYNNLKTVLFLWLSGIWIGFLPFGAIQLFSKGCKFGFSSTFFVRVFGIKGILFAVLASLPQIVLTIPLIVLYAVLNINFIRSMYKIKNRQLSKNEFYIKNLLYLIIAVLAAFIVALLDSFVMPLLLKPVCSLLSR